MSVLRVEGLSVRYGGVQALREVELEVGPGKLVGLIGPNGAGKTTFIDAVTGFARSTGRVHVNGRDVSSLRPHQRAKAGLARTFQAGELFGDLTVRENVAASARLPVGKLLRELVTGRPADDAVVGRVLDDLGIEGLADAMPESLTQAQRKLVGVGRALAASPQLVLLDEPAAGLDTSESQELGQRLRALVDAGHSMLLVDHDMGLVLSVCDEIVVLDFGAVIARGRPADIEADPKVREAYLGADVEERIDEVERQTEYLLSDGLLSGPGGEHDGPGTQQAVPAAAPPGALPAPVLELDGLSAGYNGTPVVRGLDLAVRPGEVLALLGPNGAGKTTTLRAVSRLIDPLGGVVRFAGSDLAGVGPHRLARRGLVHVPEDRGIFFGLTVAEHFKAAPGGPLDIGVALDYFPELGNLRERRAGLLSGGEQQMLALALALGRKPRMLLLDELSMGLAPVIVQRMLPVVRRYALEAPAGVLLVEQHVPLALEVADRAAVLVHGSLVLERPAAELRKDEQLLMASYLGESEFQAEADSYA
ncbi:ATP-binding cassette domain-containing protein [Blastococcus sp. SYSU D00820]